MISLPDRAALKRALAGRLQPRLRELLAERLTVTEANGVADMTHYLVVQFGDTEADIVEAIGLSPLINPIDGARFGTVSFQSWWDWLANVDGWFEMTITVGNSGFAYVLIIEDRGEPTELLRLCRCERLD